MFLEKERKVLRRFLPELHEILCALPLGEIEKLDCHALAKILKNSNVPGLLVLADLGGLGASPLDVIRIHRAVGSQAPSLAIMMTMHNFTVSFCNCLQKLYPPISELLRNAAQRRLLIASGFAEGRPGAAILDSTLYVTRTADGYLLSGSKKPCTMSSCMDILTAGVAYVDEAGQKHTGMAIVSADNPGMTRKPFWNSWLLTGTDSNEVVLKDAFVPTEHVLIANDGDTELVDAIRAAEVLGLCRFQLIVTASYLGVASALVERVLQSNKGDTAERARLCCELEAAMVALEGLCYTIDTETPSEALLARMLMVRFSIQWAIERSSTLAAELLGGLAFIGSPEVSYLLCASRALAFHPIGRKAAEPLIVAQMAATASDRWSQPGRERSVAATMG